MALFLALDAGGTTTDAALADDERILARVQGRSIKATRVTPEQARENLHALLNDVAGRAMVCLGKICATCAGISGFNLPTVGGWLRASLGEIAGGRVILCGDDEIALDAAFPGQSGILIIAGTGSNIVARASNGQRVNVGGWGPALADEGSGYWIGQQALRAAMRAWDRGEPTLLLERVATHWCAANIWEIVDRAHTTPPPDFAALAPIVNDCGEAGDAVCLGVLAEAGRCLADDAILAYRKMRALEPDASQTLGIAFTGGVLRSYGIVREHMIEGIRRQLPTAQILPQAVDPIVGGLWRARLACASESMKDSATRGETA